MYCRHCGTKNDDDTKFCKECGEKIELNQESHERLSEVKNKKNLYEKKYNSIGGVFKIKSSAKFLDDYYQQKFKSENKKALRRLFVLRFLFFISIPLGILLTVALRGIFNLIDIYQIKVILQYIASVTLFAPVIYMLIWIFFLRFRMSKPLNENLKNTVKEAIDDL